MNASAIKKPAGKSAAAKKATKPAATSKAKTPAKTAAKSAGKTATKSTKSPASKSPVKLAKPAKPETKKATAKPAAKRETAKTPAKSAVKSVTAKKSAAAAGVAVPAKTAEKPVRSAAIKPNGSAAAQVQRKPAQSEVRMRNNNAATDVTDTIQRSVVSRVSEVASKTMKSTPSAAPEGRLLTEEEILKMSDKDYMNPAQLAFFKARLQQLERDLLKNAGETTEHLRETVLVPDPADRATIEEEHALELRTRDRERKLLKKVQQSLASIESGDYGWCEETGEPIGIPRLLARPTATLSLEAQQRRELKQKLYGD